ncbi:MAG: hypothetical protein NTZ05_17245 [Chloroflexi bacterium]|nr:hypothetical protein [Chloroflexota bacterium]
MMRPITQALWGLVITLGLLFSSTSGVWAATAISAKALTDHECNSTELHFVITQLASAAQAPASVHVTWANGAQADVPLQKVTGGVGHYLTTANLGSAVVSATTTIDSAWGGQFNLSHGPCFSGGGSGGAGGGTGGGTGGATTMSNSGSTPISFSTEICGGTAVFNGTMTYNQQWTYTAEGRLNFHFIGQVKGTMTLDGKTYQWKEFSKEVDHLDYRGAAGQAGFLADGTPDLAPYGGSLPAWLANPDNFQYVYQISLSFNQRIVGKGGKALQNQVVLSANQNGINAFKTKFDNGLC